MTPKQIAKKYGCCERTAKRWKKAGAPVGSKVRMDEWLASRKHRPAASDRDIHIDPPKAATPESDGELTGAAAALRRLELEEVAAYKTVQTALAEGNAIAIKVAREGWLKIGDSLRRYDLLVEQGRRDAGELIPREEVESLLKGVSLCFTLAATTMANALVPKLQLVHKDQMKMHKILDAAFRQVNFAAASIKLKQTTIGEWAWRALREPLDFGDKDAEAKKRAEAFEVLVKEVA